LINGKWVPDEPIHSIGPYMPGSGSLILPNGYGP
jgi:hypothetical protein